MNKAKIPATVILTVLLAASIICVIPPSSNDEGQGGFWHFSAHGVRTTSLGGLEPVFTGGIGSLGDPYQITNVTELQNMTANLTAHYALVNDIDASATSGWNGGLGFAPIGNDTDPGAGDFQGTPFNGSLNGKGFNITGLSINRSAEDYIGMFGYLDVGADISNVTLADCNMTGDSRSGGCAGENLGRITNCHVSGIIGGVTHIGGFVGDNHGAIRNCTTTVGVSGSGDYVGGFTGGNYASITNCSSKGNASGNGYVSGFSAHNEATITDCTSTANASGGYTVGGFIGVDYGTISHCSSTGNASAGDTIGGFVGYSLSGVIMNCTSTGNASGGVSAGGFVGFTNGGTITDCTSTGSASAGDMVGGFAGKSIAGAITKCISTGNAGGNDEVGGFSGTNSGSITDCTSTGNAGGNWFVGGFVGYTSGGLMMDCATNGSVNGVSYLGGFVGGVFGFSPYSMTNCRSTGNASGVTCVGGFLGYQFNAQVTITNCSSTGNAGGDEWVGGFAGSGKMMTNCCSTGNADGTTHVGGFAGANSGTITSSYCTGNAGGNANVGGFTGRNNGPIANCYSTGNAEGVINVSGFAGLNNGVISYSYSTGNATGTTNVGGFSGSNTNTVGDCFWDKVTSGLTASDGGDGRNTSEMVKQTTFTSAGWDFTGNWTITEGHTYPYFSWQVNGDPNIIGDDITSATEDALYEVDYDFRDMEYPLAYPVWSLDTGPAWLTLDPVTGVLSGTPLNEHVGPNSVSVRLSDADGLSACRNFTITVANTNDAPVAQTVPHLFAEEDAPYSQHFTAVDVDPVDSLSWVLLTNADWLSLDPLTGWLNGTPDNSHVAGNWWVNMTVSDMMDETDFLSFYITVNNTNDAPVITTTNYLTISEDMEYRVQYSATDEDPAGDTLTWSLQTDAEWLSIDTSTGLLNGTPPADRTGSFSVNVSVSDGNGGSDTTTFELTVSNTNDPPVITTTPITSATQDAPFTLPLKATDPDEGDKVSWSIVCGPEWLELDGDRLEGAPGNDDVGSSWVEVKVQDLEGASDTLGYQLRVENVNDVPTWKKTPEDQANISIGQALMLEALAVDIDADDEPEHGISSDPEAAVTIGKTNGVIFWPGASTEGDYNLNVTATGGNETIWHTFTISVVPGSSQGEEGGDEEEDGEDGKEDGGDGEGNGEDGEEDGEDGEEDGEDEIDDEDEEEGTDEGVLDNWGNIIIGLIFGVAIGVILAMYLRRGPHEEASEVERKEEGPDEDAIENGESEEGSDPEEMEENENLEPEEDSVLEEGGGTGDGGENDAEPEEESPKKKSRLSTRKR